MNFSEVKQHTRKYGELAKRAAGGAFPNKKAAQIGSLVGMGIGGALLGAGSYGMAKGAAFGIGCLIAGLITVGSNGINLKRIEKI